MAINREAVAASLKAMGIDILIDKYIQMRDAVDEETNKFKSKIKDATDVADLIEAVLMEKMDQTGLQSGSSTSGTAYFADKTMCGVGDWDELLPFIMQGNPQFLNKAVNKTAVKEYMEENDGALPPGVRWDVERVLQIRKK